MMAGTRERVVFQDVALRGPESGRSAQRQALIALGVEYALNLAAAKYFLRV
jgi:hypothetical protein